MTWRKEKIRHSLARKHILTAKGQILYRGAPTPTFEVSPFKGVWLSPQKEIADQYGRIHVFELDDNIRLLNKGHPIGRELEKIFSEQNPKIEFMYNQDDDFLELWAFPPKEFRQLLKTYGYDGYTNGSDVFILNSATHKLKYIKSEEK